MTKENSTVSISETLTEQWKNNDLPAAYYYIRETPDDVIDIAVCDFDGDFVNFYMDRYLSYFHKKLTVLAPVLSYEQFVELTEKLEKLEKQLDIATKTLKKISVSLWDEMECRDCAQKALKEIDEVLR